MHGTTPGLRTDSAARLADLERRKPEWHDWLRLLGHALRAIPDPVWGAPLAAAEPDRGSNVPSQDEPLLHRRTLIVDARELCRLMRDLVQHARPLDGYRPSAESALSLVAGVLGRPRTALAALATSPDVDPESLETVARLAALPLLHSCGRLLQADVPRSWSRGYCPICGSWPLLAEMRSLDRTRCLRCGRCGGDWRINVLCCSYCGETEHERLGTLVLEGEAERWSVETCAQCGGYLKSLTTLQATHPFDLLLQDLETVELDLAALDRGFARPAGDGFLLDLQVVARSP